MWSHFAISSIITRVVTRVAGLSNRTPRVSTCMCVWPPALERGVRGTAVVARKKKYFDKFHRTVCPEGPREISRQLQFMSTLINI